MGIRQIVNDHPAVSAAVTGVLMLAAMVFLFFELRGNRPVPHPAPQAYYTDDDGKTFFADEAGKITPFVDTNGKQAVSAMVFKTARGTPFVAYLNRFTDEGRKILESVPRQSIQRVMADASLKMEAKKPGAKRWTRMDPKNLGPYITVTRPVAPDGTKAGLLPVFPTP